MAENADRKNAPSENTRLFVKITRESLPRASARYPFIYLEHGRLEVDDSSIKWLNADGMVIRLPVATLNCILLGPGTSITHEAVKVAAQANCLICWVGGESLVFYAAGFTPTADTRNFRRQAMFAMDDKISLEIARAMLQDRFPHARLEERTRQELLGMEGIRVKELYEEKAKKYGVGWKGRRYVPGKFEMSDLTNKILSLANSALYAILCAITHSLGYSPHLGFIHSGSPLPFIYDLADLYKAELCIDLAFYETLQLAGDFNRHAILEEFRRRCVEMDLAKKACEDIDNLLGEKGGRRHSK